jgi:glycosyltransferase involved in cell wall biosynthesis
MSISVVFVVKNAINQGYCFIDSLKSCLPIADEIIISEGFSDDDTLRYIMEFRDKYESQVPIHVFQDRWEEKSYHGEVIANVSMRAIEKSTFDWIYYLQADEIIPPENEAHIKHIATLDEFHSISFPFYHFIRSWEPSEEGYREAIRMVRNHRDIRLTGDAWNFEGAIDPICPAGHSPKPIYHFAWVFPPQNTVKHIEHAKIYENMPEYQENMRHALQNQLTKPYPLTDFDDFPELARRFVGETTYEPVV